MKKSAMLQAFQVLRRKPMLLLLILPVQVLSLISSTISLQMMPDLSSLLDVQKLIDGADPYSTMGSLGGMQMMSMLSTLVSSVVALVSFASLFLLIPPAMELLADGAAGVETQPGWYLRGLKRHWWKPIVDSLVVGGIYTVLLIPLVIIFYVALIAVAFSSMGFVSSTEFGASTADTVNGVLSGVVPSMLIAVVIFASIVAVLELFVYSVFGLFLPALGDRGFGGAFKLMFSRKGFRALPKLLGGKLLIALVPGLFLALLGVAYFVIHGVANGPFGALVTLIDFMKSWTGTLGLLFVSLFSLLTYAFRFSVYQQVCETEAVEQARPAN